MGCLIMPKACWCGNIELLPYSEDYNRCDACHTLVNRGDFDESICNVQDESNDLYGANYWEDYILKHAGIPTLYELHDLYLTDRCIYWLQILTKYLPPPASIVEIGCGMGQMLYLAKQAGFKGIGVEPSPKICDYAQRVFGVDLLCGTVDDIEGVYDAVLCMDLVEHIIDPIAFMQRVMQHSNSNSLLMIQTPFYNPDMDFNQMRIISPRFEKQMLRNQHIFIFSRQSIQMLLHQTGFSNIQFEPAVFGDDYDMFLVASMSPLVEHEQSYMLETLANQQPGGWLIRAMCEMHKMYRNVQEQLNDTQHKLNDTQHRLSATHDELLAVYNSRSWRITKPLRYACEMGRRMVQVIRR